MIQPFRITPTVYVLLAPVKGKNRPFTHCSACRTEARIGGDVARAAMSWTQAHERECAPARPGYRIR